eukprot:3770776-Pleurochrysis_carterae.AAC.1
MLRRRPKCLADSTEEVDDAREHSSSAEASDAEGVGEETDSQANSDGVDSGDPDENVEAPAPAEEQDDSPPEGAAHSSGPAAQEPTKIPEYRYSRRQVRLCQTPEVCCLLPLEATMAHLVKTYAGLNYETDFITNKALRDISELNNTEEYTACADQFVSRATAGLYSVSVAWVEIDDDSRKSVVQVRVLKTGRGNQPFAYSWIGLTQETYRRMLDGLCPTTPPRTLPP